MVAIKITYGSSVHKFNVAIDSTWASFEYNLRTLFKIPDNYKVIASYTDEDNDVITLSSDIELREVLYHHSNDTNTPVRLVLNAIPTTNNSNNNKEIQETFEKMSIADDEKCCATETETETETEREHVCDETCEKSYDEKCCNNNKSSDEKCCEDEEEDTEQSSSDPEVYYFVCSKRGPRFGSAKFDSFENSSGRCPFKRGEFVPPPHHRQSRGGPSGPFGPFGPFNHHGGPPPHHRGPGPRGFHGHPPSHPPPEYTEIHKKHHGEFEEFGPHGGEFSHFGPFGHGPFGHGPFGHGSFGHGGHSSFGHGGHGRFHGHGGRGPRNNREKECCKEGKENRKDDKECNKGEKCENDTTDPRIEHGPHVPPGSHGPHSLPAFRGPHGPHGHHGNPRMRGHHHASFRGHGHGHGHGFRHHHHHRPRGGPHCHRHHKPLTPEELAEKVALLNSMNFPSDKNAHYEELLKKFHGRIGRVVEILLCERKHKDDEDHKEPDGDDNSDDDSNNDDPNNEFEEIKESETSPFLV